jgi:hypothetical protein
MKTTSATLRVCWHTHQLQVYLEQTPPDSFEVLSVWSLTTFIISYETPTDSVIKLFANHFKTVCQVYNLISVIVPVSLVAQYLFCVVIDIS